MAQGTTRLDAHGAIHWSQEHAVPQFTDCCSCESQESTVVRQRERRHTRDFHRHQNLACCIPRTSADERHVPCNCRCRVRPGHHMSCIPCCLIRDTKLAQTPEVEIRRPRQSLRSEEHGTRTTNKLDRKWIRRLHWGMSVTHRHNNPSRCPSYVPERKTADLRTSLRQQPISRSIPLWEK